MKKIYFLIIGLVALFIIGGIPQKATVKINTYYAGIDDITDPSLKACIMADDEYSSGIANITSIDCRYPDTKIKSTAGISQMTALKTLILAGNSLTSIDVSALTNLEYLNVGDNKLSSLDLSHNTKLKKLYMMTNNITSIDLSHNTDLEDIQAHKPLNNIDLSANTKLKYLRLQEIANFTLPANNVIEGITFSTTEKDKYIYSNFPQLKLIHILDGNSKAIYGTTLKKSDIFDLVPDYITLKEYKLYDTYDDMHEINDDFDSNDEYHGEIGKTYPVYLCAGKYNNSIGEEFNCGNVEIEGAPAQVTEQYFRGYYSFYFANITSDKYKIDEQNWTITVDTDNNEEILQNIKTSSEDISVKIEGDKLLVINKGSTIATFTIKKVSSRTIEVPNTASTIFIPLIVGLIIIGTGIVIITKTKKLN